MTVLWLFNDTSSAFNVKMFQVRLAADCIWGLSTI